MVLQLTRRSLEFDTGKWSYLSLSVSRVVPDCGRGSLMFCYVFGVLRSKSRVPVTSSKENNGFSSFPLASTVSGSSLLETF